MLPYSKFGALGFFSCSHVILKNQPALEMAGLNSSFAGIFPNSVILEFFEAVLLLRSPGTHHIAQAGLKLRECLPLPP